MKVVMSVLRFIFYLPLYLYLFIFYKRYVIKELDPWYNILLIERPSSIILQVMQLLRLPEFRSILYYRCKISSLNLIIYIYPPLSTLYIPYDQVIGEGLVIQHGYSTIFNCEKLGKNCQVWQGVTIGKAKSGKNQPRPVIGDNVKICCHAIVIGGITVGNNVTIGAGAVVRTDIPDNSVVIGNPAKLIKCDGQKCDILL